jgi:hypothetical protein
MHSFQKLDSMAPSPKLQKVIFPNEQKTAIRNLPQVPKANAYALGLKLIPANPKIGRFIFQKITVVTGKFKTGFTSKIQVKNY